MKRLESLDILRGIDLFLLVVFGPAMLLLARTGDYFWEPAVMPQFHHVDWAGFTLWDLLMPLFLFSAGVAIPYSLEKYRGPGIKRSKVYFRIFRRFVLLWVLGMVAQGHLLDLDWSVLRFYSNTLQSIAVGYLFASLFFLWFRPSVQVVISAVLLLGFWVLMMTVGDGNFNEHGNLCETVDNLVLGAHRDHASRAADGSLVVDADYTYTWIVSSLNFIVTVMTGMFAGEILKGVWTERKKMLTLLAVGAAMVAAGWLWHLQMPVIKHIWTSSMVLVSSGYCFLALVVIYYIVDYRKKGRWMSFFKIWGMNSILAYMMHQVLRFTSVSEALFHGLERFMSPEWYKFIIGIVCIGIEVAIMKICYDRKIFLKV